MPQEVRITPISLTPIGKSRDLKDTSVENSLYYTDMALLRKKSNALEILSSREFNAIFAKRQNDKYWNSVDYVQANVKAKIGIGKKFNFLFLYDMYRDDENDHPNLSQVNKSVAELSPKKNDQPLKDYEEINYHDGQLDNLTGMKGEQL